MSEKCTVCGHDRHDHDWWGSGPCLECDCARFADVPCHADDLHEALQALVDVVDRIGGYMSPGDQAVLWRARTLSR